MRYTLLAGVSAVAFGLPWLTSPAQAGNILLTGHDNDFHCTYGDSNACAALGAEASYVRAGSSLPMLVIDDGTELSGSLSGLGVPIVSVSVGSVTAGMFNHSVYSAFAVASVTSCGGCDNPTGTGTALAGFSSAIASFFDAGGGILGLTSAGDPNGFAYVPDAAGSPTPIFTSSGFTATPTGLAGIPGFIAVNGDETHNVFAEPGTGGVSSFYDVAERFTYNGGTGQPVTLFGTGAIVCTGSSCTIHGVPEPISLSMLGVGLFGLAAARRYRRRSAT
jgi:hypothetical protein